MCRSMIRTCRSEKYTVYTAHIRCVVYPLRLIFQRVEACLYGIYGFFGHTPYIYDYFFSQKENKRRVSARVRRILTPYIPYIPYIACQKPL